MVASHRSKKSRTPRGAAERVTAHMLTAIHSEFGLTTQGQLRALVARDAHVAT